MGGGYFAGRTTADMTAHESEVWGGGGVGGVISPLRYDNTTVTL